MFARQGFVLALAAALSAAACSKVHHGHPVDPYTYEIEPNDVSWEAHGLGPIGAGEGFLVRGTIDDTGHDPYDGFALLAEHPMDVEFRLFADSGLHDFDVALFDPYTAQTVASWESAADPEAGVFSVLSAGTEFHLVVSSFHGSGAYTFEIVGRPLSGYAAAGAGTARLAATPVEGRMQKDWKAYAAARAGALAQPEPRDTLVPLYRFRIDPRTGRAEALEPRVWLRVERAPDGV